MYPKQNQYLLRKTRDSVRKKIFRNETDAKPTVGGTT